MFSSGWKGRKPDGAVAEKVKRWTLDELHLRT